MRLLLSESSGFDGVFRHILSNVAHPQSLRIGAMGCLSSIFLQREPNK
jgi:hypothetical protein